MLVELVAFGRSLPKVQSFVASNRELEQYFEEARKVGKRIRGYGDFRLADGAVVNFNSGSLCYRCDYVPPGKGITSVNVWDPHFEGRATNFRLKTIRRLEPDRAKGDMPESLYVANEELMSYTFGIDAIDPTYRGTIESTDVTIWGRPHNPVALLQTEISYLSEGLCPTHAAHTYTLTEVFGRIRDHYSAGEIPANFADRIRSHFSEAQIPLIQEEMILLRPTPAITQRLPQHTRG